MRKRQVQPSVHPIRLQDDDTAKLFDRRGVVAGLREHFGVVVAYIGVVRRDPQRIFEGLARNLRPTVGPLGDGQQIMGLPGVGRRLQHPAGVRGGGGAVACG